jgi:hypothetical protein
MSYKPTSQTGPTFLGIGPPKTATTWLYYALNQHPEIDFPPVKEIGYLWEKNNLPHRHYFSLFLDSHWFYVARRRYLYFCVKEHLKQLCRFKLDTTQLQWDIHYLLAKRNIDWYKKLFNSQKISGDITPKYCELSTEQIKEIHKKFNHLKIIITLRDPIERDWSRAKMNLLKSHHSNIEHIDNSLWLEQFFDPMQSQANDYVQLHKSWADVFGYDNVLVIFYEQIENEAWKTYCELCKFLNIGSPSKDIEPFIDMPIGAGVKAEIPEYLREYLITKNLPHIQQAIAHFKNTPYPNDWLKKYSVSR